MDFATALDHLEERLKRPLPGVSAQRTMAPVGRIPPDYESHPRGARDGAVLILLCPGPELVFIRRAEDGGHHSGQIAFPGGGREPEDKNPIGVALRETQEEIGVPAESIRVLGSLSRLYIPVSNYSVQPVVGCVDALPHFVPDPREVDEVIVLPLKGIDEARNIVSLRFSSRVLTTPAYQFDAVVIWGATAMMLAEFLKVWDEAVDSATAEPRAAGP